MTASCSGRHPRDHPEFRSGWMTTTATLCTVTGASGESGRACTSSTKSAAPGRLVVTILSLQMAVRGPTAPSFVAANGLASPQALLHSEHRRKRQYKDLSSRKEIEWSVRHRVELRTLSMLRTTKRELLSCSTRSNRLRGRVINFLCGESNPFSGRRVCPCSRTSAKYRGVPANSGD
jgi:hypothetical protein